MIKDIRDLRKINEILNAKGTILGLLQYKDKYYLSSNLEDQAGRVYCSVEEPTLARYFNNELRLQDVFLASKEFVVPHNFRNFMKEQLTEIIACGKRLFSENSDGMRNDSLAEVFAR